MNISVYLPNHLKRRFDVYIRNNGITQNAAIRKAIELLLKNDSNKKWGDWVNQLEPDAGFPDIEEIRRDLKPPKENIF